jgi:hypothetical protein
MATPLPRPPLSRSYRERLVLTRALTLRAWPQGAAPELVWETEQPYQSTIDIRGGPGGGGDGSAAVRLEVRPPLPAPACALRAAVCSVFARLCARRTFGAPAHKRGCRRASKGLVVDVRAAPRGGHALPAGPFLQGLVIRHASKSVANNFGVYIGVRGAYRTHTQCSAPLARLRAPQPTLCRLG